MILTRLAAACFLAIGLSTVAVANEKAAAPEKEVDYYAIPVPKLVGTVVKVEHTLKDKDKKASKTFLGIPKVIFKQNGKVVHEGNMKPGWGGFCAYSWNTTLKGELTVEFSYVKPTKTVQCDPVKFTIK